MYGISLKYVLAGIIIIVILGSAGYYFYSQKPAAYVAPAAMPAAAPETAATSTPQASPQVDLNLKNTSTLAIGWQDLPEGTNIVNIYRSPKGKNTWIRWQAISVSHGANEGITTLTNGTTDILIGKNDFSLYSYYFQAISGSGDVLFTSGIGQSQSSLSSGQSPEQSQNGSNSPSNSGESGSSPDSTPIIGGFNLTMAQNTSTNQTQNNLNQSNTGTSSTQPQPNQTATGTSPVGSTNPPVQTATSTIPKSIPTGTVSVAVQGTYYSPDGTPTGSGTQGANFWALHVNENIELGWQNLPANTDRIIVYRSASLSGPWVKLLEQKNLIITEPSFVRLVDNTIGNAYYYRLSAYGEGTILVAYNPVLLPAE